MEKAGERCLGKMLSPRVALSLFFFAVVCHSDSWVTALLFFPVLLALILHSTAQALKWVGIAYDTVTCIAAFGILIFIRTHSDDLAGTGILMALMSVALINVVVLLVLERPEMAMLGCFVNIVVVLGGIRVWYMWISGSEGGGGFWPPPHAAWLLSVGVVNLITILQKQQNRLWAALVANPLWLLSGVLLFALMLMELWMLYVLPRVERSAIQHAVINWFVEQEIGIAWSERDWWIAYVGLASTEVADDEIVLLTLLPKLESLNVNDTAITDEGLKYMEQLEQLRRLDVSGTKVSRDGVRRLKKALPNLRVTSDFD